MTYDDARIPYRPLHTERDGGEAAHRLSTVQRADLMVVLEKGRIVECGQPGKLLAAGGRYATLFTLQFSASQARG